MNKQKSTEPLSDSEIFRQSIGDVVPLKSNNTVHQKRETKPTLSILQKASNYPHKEQKKEERKKHQQIIKEPPPIQQQVIPPSTKPIKKNTNRPLTLQSLYHQVSDHTGGYSNRMEASLAQLHFNRRGEHCTLFRRLKKGQINVEHELDLHHLIITEAKRTTLECLLYAHREKLLCIRIIHGKGLNSKEGYSPIKYAVNHWLRQVPIVRAFCSCTPQDGGTGAIYVLMNH